MILLDTHTAIVGASGAGKTVTAKGHVEALLSEGRHVCILDPTGAWYGLRADGDGPGFDIPIFGGARGDVEISAEQGEAVGGIIAGGVSAIVDISALRTGSEQRRFARDLCRALRAKPDGHFHFVVDEADEFAAQKPRDDYGFQVGEELIWMAKRGRLAGFVLTLITQRPASIDKEVLTQAQTLIVHQLVAPVDQKPIVDYLKDNADRAALTSIKASLASLARGERWIYSPRAGVLERGVSPMPTTFDSSRTPGPGERAVEPKMLAEIDLSAIREALAPTAPKSDPDIDDTMKRPEWGAEINRLRTRVAELEGERDEWGIERSYGQQRIDALVAERDELRRIVAEFQEKWARIRIALEDDKPSPGALPAPVQPKPQLALSATTGAEQGVTAGETAEGRRSGDSRHPSTDLPAAAVKMLDMLDRMNPARVSWASLAGICGYKPRGGNFNAARKAMRESARLIEDGDSVRSAAEPRGGMTREAARQLWKEVLLNPAPQMIDALAVRPMTRQALGDFMGKVARGGHFNNGVAQLLRNGVAVEVAGRLQLAEPLPGESQ